MNFTKWVKFNCYPAAKDSPSQIFAHINMFNCRLSIDTIPIFEYHLNPTILTQLCLWQGEFVPMRAGNTFLLLAFATLPHLLLKNPKVHKVMVYVNSNGVWMNFEQKYWVILNNKVRIVIHTMNHLLLIIVRELYIIIRVLLKLFIDRGTF